MVRDWQTDCRICALDSQAEKPIAGSSPGAGASRRCPRRTANRPGSQSMARYKITDFLQSASAGRHAADGDRPRSGDSIEMRPQRHRVVRLEVSKERVALKQIIVAVAR